MLIVKKKKHNQGIVLCLCNKVLEMTHICFGTIFMAKFNKADTCAMYSLSSHTQNLLFTWYKVPPCRYMNELKAYLNLHA